MITKKKFKFIMQLLIEAYIFLAITNINTQLSIIKSIPIETALWSLIICGGLIQLYFNIKSNLKISINFHLSILFAFLFSSFVILSSFSNQLGLSLFSNSEFTHILKFLLLIPFVHIFFDSKASIHKLIKLVVIFYSFLAVIFLYRYLVLNEIRVFDGRPTIKIRHGDPNFLGAFFVMILPFCIYIYSTAKSLLEKYYFAFASLILFISIFATQSRASIIALILSLILLIIKVKSRFSRKKLLLVAFTVILLFASFFGKSILQRYQNMTDKSNLDRLKTYYNAYHIFKNNPYLGVGFHQAKNYYFKNTGNYKLDYNTPPLEVHNTLLEVLAELGIFGLFVFSFLLLRPIYLIKNNFRKCTPQDKSLSLFCLSSILGLFICSLIVGLAYKDLFMLQIQLLILVLSNQSYEPFKKLQNAKA